MMHTVEVTAVEQTKRGRYSIFLDGEFYCALHMDIFLFAGINKGTQITLERMEELRRQSEQRITRERALKLLGQRAYTQKGLRDKLRERTDEDSADEAVSRMVELGLVDDEDYARRYAADCMNLKGFSLRRTAQELARKGIDREIIDAVLEELEDDPQPAIAGIILRKYRAILYNDDEKATNRAVNALIRLGYRYGDIRTVLANLTEDEDYYNEYE